MGNEPFTARLGSLALFALSALAVSTTTLGCGGEAAPAGGSSSGMGCTNVACADGLSIELVPSTGRGRGWPAGTYRFDIEADDAKVTCTGTLPLPACGQPAILCTPSSASHTPRIGESGCALPANAQSFANVQFSTTPTQVHVRLERDGAFAGDLSASPSYVTSAPNGPNCAPVCTNARLTMLVDVD